MTGRHFIYVGFAEKIKKLLLPVAIIAFLFFPQIQHYFDIQIVILEGPFWLRYKVRKEEKLIIGN